MASPLVSSPGADAPVPADRLAQACATMRHSPHRLLHKALRVRLTDALQAAGRLDALHPAQRAQLVTLVDGALAACLDHVVLETRWLHEPLRQRSPRALAAVEDDHRELAADAAQLRARLAQLQAATRPAEFLALGHEVYLRFSQFVGEGLAHMVEEEGALALALWDSFDDAQLQGFEAQMLAALPAGEREQVLHDLKQALGSAERPALRRALDLAGRPDAFQIKDLPAIPPESCGCQPAL